MKRSQTVPLGVLVPFALLVACAGGQGGTRMVDAEPVCGIQYDNEPDVFEAHQYIECETARSSPPGTRDQFRWYLMPPDRYVAGVRYPLAKAYTVVKPRDTEAGYGKPGTTVKIPRPATGG